MKAGAIVFTFFGTVIHDNPACCPSRQIISNSFYCQFQARPIHYHGRQYKAGLTHPAATFHTFPRYVPDRKISAAFLDASVKKSIFNTGLLARYPSYNDNNIAEFGSSLESVNDHKKKRWSLAAKPAGERVISAFFLNTAYAWQQEYIVYRNPDIPQSVTPGIAIINLITRYFVATYSK